MFVVVGKAPVMQAQIVNKINTDGVYKSPLFETNLVPLIGSEEPQIFQI